MMCIPSIRKALWSWGLLLAVKRVVVVPLPTMACAICLQSFAGDRSHAVLLTCRHSFHKVCLEKHRQERGLDSIKAMKCPTCMCPHGDMTEKEDGAQFLVAGDTSSQSVPEILRSQGSEDDRGAAPTQAASPTQVATFHGFSSQVASGNSPVTRNYGRNALGMFVRKKAFRKCDYTDEGHLNQFVSEDAAADFEGKRYANGQHQDGYSTEVKDSVPSRRSLFPKRALPIRVLIVFLKRA